MNDLLCNEGEGLRWLKDEDSEVARLAEVNESPTRRQDWWDIYNELMLLANRAKFVARNFTTPGVVKSNEERYFYLMRLATIAKREAMWDEPVGGE